VEPSREEAGGDTGVRGEESFSVVPDSLAGSAAPQLSPLLRPLHGQPVDLLQREAVRFGAVQDGLDVVRGQQ